MSALKFNNSDRVLADYKEAKLEFDKAKTRFDALKKIVEGEAKAGGDDFYDCGTFGLKKVERKGSVNYKEIPAVAAIPDAELEKFRRPPSVSYKFVLN